MEQLTQSELEWLRCLTVSRQLTPVLPDHIRVKLEGARLLDAKSGKAVITESGTILLRDRTPQTPPELKYFSRLA